MLVTEEMPYMYSYVHPHLFLNPFRGPGVRHIKARHGHIRAINQGYYVVL